MIDENELNTAFDEWMRGEWNGVYAGKLEAGMMMRDGAGGVAEITGVYPSADECVYVEARNRTGVHIPKRKLALIRPATK